MLVKPFETPHRFTKVSCCTAYWLPKLQPLTQQVLVGGMGRIFGIFSNLWTQDTLVFEERT